MVLEIALSCVASTGLFSLIQFLITRRDKKKDAVSGMSANLHQLELDTKRTQLLLLMANYPEETMEILTVGEKYFGDLGGDWYMDTLFSAWLADRNLPKPSWLKEES